MSETKINPVFTKNLTPEALAPLATEDNLPLLKNLQATVSSMDQSLEYANFDELQVQKKARVIMRNIALAAEKASQFLNDALDDSSISPTEKIKISQYVIDRMLGKPATNVFVDQKSLEVVLKGEVGDAAELQDHFSGNREIRIVDDEEQELIEHEPEDPTRD